MNEGLVQFGLTAFVALLVVVNPPGVVPIFVSLTEGAHAAVAQNFQGLGSPADARLLSDRVHGVNASGQLARAGTFVRELDLGPRRALTIHPDADAGERKIMLNPGRPGLPRDLKLCRSPPVALSKLFQICPPAVAAQSLASSPAPVIATGPAVRWPGPARASVLQVIVSRRFRLVENLHDL